MRSKAQATLFTCAQLGMAEPGLEPKAPASSVLFYLACLPIHGFSPKFCFLWSPGLGLKFWDIPTHGAFPQSLLGCALTKSEFQKPRPQTFTL